MSDMIPFDKQAGLTTTDMPTISEEAAAKSKADMGGGLSGLTIPRIATRNGNFWLQPGGGTEPKAIGSEVDVLIVAMPPTMQRVFYKGAYDPNQPATAPDCFSSDNETPSPAAKDPQNDKCATCRQNQKGSAKEGADARACAFKKNIVVMAPDQARVLEQGGDPEIYLMSVNGQSMFAPSIPDKNQYALQGYYEFLNPAQARQGAPHGIPFQYVVTHLEFDMQATTPKIFFSAKGWLTDNLGELVWQFSSDERVTKLLDVALNSGGAEVADPVDDDDEGTTNEQTQPAKAKAGKTTAAKKPAAKAKGTAKKKAAAKTKPAPAPEPAAAPAEPEPASDLISWQQFALDNDADPDDIEAIEDAGGPTTEKGMKRWDKYIGLEFHDGVDLGGEPTEPEPATEPAGEPDDADELAKSMLSGFSPE